jgi:uncharacterized protein YhbP (UPF0306 family)
MNPTEKQLERVTQLLREQTTLSLATTGEDGMPSVAPLFYFADENLTLYWLSSPASLHSRNLMRSPRAATNIYRNALSWREIRGVQIIGSVCVIAEPKLRATILERYCQRFHLGRVLKVAVRQSVLHALQPEFIRYIDNSSGFKSKFEWMRTQQGWTPASL